MIYHTVCHGEIGRAINIYRCAIIGMIHGTTIYGYVGEIIVFNAPLISYVLIITGRGIVAVSESMWNGENVIVAIIKGSVLYGYVFYHDRLCLISVYACYGNPRTEQDILGRIEQVFS